MTQHISVESSRPDRCRHSLRLQISHETRKRRDHGDGGGRQQFLRPYPHPPGGEPHQQRQVHLLQSNILVDHWWSCCWNLGIHWPDGICLLLSGANSFLFTQYKYLAAFTAIFAVVIFLFLESVHWFSTDSQPCQYTKGKTCKPALANAVFSTIAFLLGAITSVISGYLGMRIATFANARTTLEARRGIGAAFATAFRSGAVMGFLLASLGLLVLYIAIKLFGLYYHDDWEGLYDYRGKFN